MPVLLSPEALAAQLGIRAVTLAKWRTQGRGPAFVKVGGRVRYPEASVARWLRAQLRSETAGRRRRLATKPSAA